MFTVRYGLSPYITQIRFVFKGLIHKNRSVEYEETTSVGYIPIWGVCTPSASQEIPHILRNPLLITVPTAVRHLSQSWAMWIQSTRSNSTTLTFTLLSLFHLRLGLPNRLFPRGFPTKALNARLFCLESTADPGMNLAIYVNTAPRLRMSWAMLHLPHMPSWHSQGQVHFNPLSTKMYLSDLKTQFVPRSKHSLLRF